jgi:hypothetical protein
MPVILPLSDQRVKTSDTIPRTCAHLSRKWGYRRLTCQTKPPYDQGGLLAPIDLPAMPARDRIAGRGHGGLGSTAPFSCASSSR